MLDLGSLRDKQVLFRFNNQPSSLYYGQVKYVEPHGIWLFAPDMVSQLGQDAAWKNTVGKLKGTALLFIPIQSLCFLIATDN
jgi:hypothetical protein